MITWGMKLALLKTCGQVGNLRALTALQEILSDAEVLLRISALGLSLVYVLPKPVAVEMVSEARRDMGTK